MFKFTSLTAKFIFMGSIVLALITAYIISTHIFTHHMEGESKRVNFAGRERMILVDIARHQIEIADTQSSAKRKSIIEHTKQEMKMYEETLIGLRDGSEKHGISPIHSHAKEAIEQNNKLIDMWQKIQKPEIEAMMNIPDKRKAREFNVLIYSYIDEVDNLVSFIEKHTEKEIKDFDTFRFYTLGFFFVAVFFMFFYIRRSITKPVWKLKEAAKTIEGGNFDIRAEIKTADEIGMLGSTFNSMVKTIATHITELEILNRLSKIVSKTLSIDELLNTALNEILNLEPLRLEKKGAIFLYDEKKRALELLVSHNFGDEQKKGCGIIPEGECLCGIVAGQEDLLISESNIEDKRHTKVYPDAKEHGHIIVPLKSRNRMRGVLSLYLPKGIILSDREIELYKSIADIISVSMQNALNHRQVAMLAQSLDSSTDLIIITDMEGKIIHANPQVVKRLGYTQDEIIGMNASVMQSPKNPQGFGKERYEKTLEGGWEGEVINIRKDGTEYPVLLTTSPVKDSDGNIIALIGIAGDITERKKAEDALRKSEAGLREAQRIANLGNWDWDIVNDKAYCSEEVDRILGFDPGEFGRNYEAFMKTVHPDDKELVEKIMQEAVREGKSFDYDRRVVWHDGTVRIVHEHGEIVRDNTGKPVRLFGTIQDITERKRAEAAREERTRLAEFTAGIGNILNRDIALTEILKACTEVIVKDLDAAFARIWTLSADGKYLELQASSGMYTHLNGPHGRIPIDENLKIPMIARNRKPHLTNAVIGDQQVNNQEWAKKEGMTSFAGYPLLIGEQLLGVMAIFSKHILSDFSLSALSAVAGSISLGIERKRAEKRLNEHSEELLSLAEASNVILTTTTTTTAENLYETVCDVAVRKFGLKLSWLGLIKKNGEIKPVAAADSEGGYLASLKPGLDEPLYATCPVVSAIKTKTPKVLNDLIKDPCPGPCGGEMALSRGCKSLMTSPLINTSGEIMGIIGFYSSKTEFFTPERIKLLNVYSNQAAGLLENRLLIEGLEEKVTERTREIENVNLALHVVNQELQTRRIEAEEAKGQAESASRAKSDFLANMSHELRTPLNSIIGFSEVMRDGFAGTVTDDQKEYLNDIWESGKHLLRLINDILNLSKVEAGKMELELSELDVKELINGCLTLFREKAMRHNIKLTSDVHDDIGTVQADETKIKQVILNLLGNAFKFTLDRGNIIVSWRRVRSSEFGVHCSERGEKKLLNG